MTTVVQTPALHLYHLYLHHFTKHNTFDVEIVRRGVTVIFN